MIRNISAIIHNPNSAFIGVRAWKKPTGTSNLRYVKLTEDIVQFTKTKSAEILNSNPQTEIKDFNPAIDDSRIEALRVKQKAYTDPLDDDKFPPEFLCVDSTGKTRLKPHLYLSYIEVKPEFARQGICSEIERKLVKLAELNGMEKRIILDSRKIEGPDMTEIPSPALAHWKNGFRFANPDNNIIMKKVLSGELPPEDAPEGTMYFAENIL